MSKQGLSAFRDTDASNAHASVWATNIPSRRTGRVQRTSPRKGSRVRDRDAGHRCTFPPTATLRANADTGSRRAWHVGSRRKSQRRHPGLSLSGALVLSGPPLAARARSLFFESRCGSSDHGLWRDQALTPRPCLRPASARCRCEPSPRCARRHRRQRSSSSRRRGSEPARARRPTSRRRRSPPVPHAARR